MHDTVKSSLAVVAERHVFYCGGLSAMLHRELGFSEVVRAPDYPSLDSILSRDANVDFIVFDFKLTGASGIDTVSEISRKKPATRLAVLSDTTDSSLVLSILAAGAHGVILKKSTDCASLSRALQTIAGGGVFVPPKLLEPHSETDQRNGKDHRLETLDGLTHRQRQVIKLLSEGHANKVIARELGISPSTVKVHVHAAFRALGVHSRLAALVALRSPDATLAER
jgi:DNA-binding NarL/FixJ family response regulator